MNVLYDYQAFYMQTHGGVSNCFVQLINNLPPDVAPYIGVKYSENIHLKNLTNKDFCPEFKPIPRIFKGLMSKFNFSGGSFLYRNAKGGVKLKFTSRQANRNYCVNLLKNGKIDVFHPTYYSGYFLKHIGKTPFVLTIHDMIHELYPQYFGVDAKMITSQKRLLASKAAHIIAVSQNTKNDIIDILNVPKDKISVIWHGAPDDFVDDNQKPLIDGRYVLFVGARTKYKNFIPFVKEFAKIADKFPDLKIVCTGIDFSNEELSVFEQLKLKNRIVRIFANNVQLANLYSYSQALIFPSLYEGFGIPILEAYKMGCPVLLNKKSCFPEIADDAALYFTLDENFSDFTDVLIKLLNFSDLERKKLIDCQNKRLQIFSWKQSAEKLSEIYRGIV